MCKFSIRGTCEYLFSGVHNPLFFLVSVCSTAGSLDLA